MNLGPLPKLRWIQYSKKGGDEKNYQNTIYEKLGAHNDSFQKCQRIHVTNEAAFKTSFYFENWWPRKLIIFLAYPVKLVFESNQIALAGKEKLYFYRTISITT